MAASRATVVPIPRKMRQMKVAQVSSPGADFQMVEREIPEPDAGQVRIKVQACGVCHSDVFTKEGWWPGIQYPRHQSHQPRQRLRVRARGDIECPATSLPW